MAEKTGWDMYEEEGLVPDRLLLALSEAEVFPEELIDGMVNTGYHPRSGYRTELSEAEKMAVRCIASGMTSDQAAEALGKSHHTVKSQLQSARLRMKAKNITHMCCEAIRQGLIP